MTADSAGSVATGAGVAVSFNLPGSPRVVIVVPGHRGNVCGITEYGFRLAEAGVSAGAAVLVIGLTSMELAGVDQVQRLSPHLRPRLTRWECDGTAARSDALRAALRTFKPDWISLQFDPLMFREGKFHVFKMLRLGRLLRAHAPLLLTVHETADVFRSGARHRGGWMLRVRAWECALGLRRMRARRIFAATRLHLDQLARMGLAAEQLPIGSNISRVAAGPPARPPGLAADAPIALLFGRIDPAWDPAPVLAALRRAWGDGLAVVSVGEVGFAGAGWARVLAAANGLACCKVGFVTPEVLSAWLSEANVGICPTPFALWPKSSACTAMLVHELPIVFSDPAPHDEVLWPPRFAVIPEGTLQWIEAPADKVAEPLQAPDLWVRMFGGGRPGRDGGRSAVTASPVRPLIGVLVNNYNNGPWLRECVESVLGQQPPPDEVIVYDDGSTDGSLAILRSFGDRIRLIAGVHRQDRPGIVSQGAALAAAFAVSRAEHLYLLDGDDKFLPGKIAAYEDAWRATPTAALVQSPMILVDEAGQELGDNYEGRKHCGDYRRAIYRAQDCDLYYATSALAFHRNYLAQELPLDYSIHQDAPIDARLAPGAVFFGPVLTLEACYSWWRQRPSSISHLQGQRDPLSATLRRHRVFNDFARRRGCPPIRLGLNLRFYRQVARRLLPQWVSAPFAKNPEGRR